MKKSLLILFLLLLSANIFAQINLVKNPGFENYISCPHFSYVANAAANWSGIVDTSYSLDTNLAYHGVNGEIVYLDGKCVPSYCNICDNDSLDPDRGAIIPNNAFFYHYPRTGNGLMCVDIYEYNSGFTGRMYLQGRLYRTLTAGKTYCVSFYVINSNGFNAGCNKIGAYFDNGIIDTTIECGHAKTEYTPQIIDDSIVFDTTNWTRIQGTFTANGTEKFITIGNFADSASISFAKYTGSDPLLTYAVYLMDDISVIAIDDSAHAGPGGITSPTGDSVQIGDTTGYLPCYWYAGTIGSGTWALIDSNTAGFKVRPDSSTKYVMALDVCGHVTTDTATVMVYPLNLKISQFENLKIYPNPANNMINIVGASGCEVAFFDIVGSKVFATFVNSNKQTLDISSLCKGFYSVEVTDFETGERIVKKVVKE